MDHEELVQMGFPASFAKDALAKHKGDIEAALIYLTSPEVADEIQRHKNQEFHDAGALSDSNDVEMQRAIQQSVQQTGGAIDITDEDEEMQKAIEQSVQGNTIVIDETSKNPAELIRPDFSFPVGLRNVGNTCYLNSMVQAFFTIPAVREKILQLNWSKEAEASEDAKEKLRFELQQLFGLLQLSDRKHVDPLNLVNALFKDEHLKLKLGQQEDPSEFGLFFSELLCGLKDAGELLKPLIVGETVSTLTAEEEDGSRVSIKTTEEILQTILEVEGMATIYDSLDKFTSMETIEGYETAKGHKTLASKIGFFHKSPPILSFQLKRSLFNAKTHVDYKLHSRFFFPDQLHLNRYLDINRERTLALRKRAQGFADEIAVLNGKLHEFKKYSGPAEYRIDHCFDAVLNYYRQNKSDLREVLELLQMEKNNIEFNISRLEENIADLRSQSDHLFDEFSNDPYHLHAVLVHSGSTPRGGHYYTFIKTHLPNDEVRWFKFNDNEITPVSFENVCSSSFGSDDSHSSAYCLIYIHNRLVEARKPHDIENVNIELRQHVEILNQKLRDDARDWEAAQQKIFVVVPEIKAKFEAKFPEVMKGINPAMVIDQSSRDFEVFLYALEKEKLGNYILADRVLREIVQQPIETIKPGTEQFRVLSDALPQVPWDLSADDRTVLSNIRQIYDKYIQVLNIWITGIEKFIAKDFSTADILLFSALREFLTIDSHLPPHLKQLSKNLREGIIITTRKWGASVRGPPIHGEAVLEFANYLTSLRYDFGRFSDLEGVATEMSNQVRHYVRSYSVDKMSEILSTIEGELIAPLRVVAPEVTVDTTILERTTKAYAEFDAIRRH